jgi:hypothetical protein
MVAGQKIALGRIHARKVVSVRVSPDTITIEIGAHDIRTIRRTTDQPVRNLQAQRSRKTANVPRPPGNHVLGQIRQASGGTRQCLGAWALCPPSGDARQSSAN